MRIDNEEALLNEEVRARIIEEIGGRENRERKQSAYKRYKCYKDQTHLYVLDHLIAQFDDATVQEMQYALCNISFTKKIVNKLARVYSNGVKRECKRKGDTKKVEEHEKLLKFNQVMKKLNRFLRLQQNVLLYVKPVKVGEKYRPKLVPLQPFFYDVIEDPNDPETPMAVILSHFTPESGRYSLIDPANRESRGAKVRKQADGMHQAIADRPEDSPPEADLEKGKLIWWTKQYHFVTDAKGVIVASESTAEGPMDISNPIQRLPFEVFAVDQDNAFWAEGGDDIVDGSIRINTQLANLVHIGVTQGYGQLVLSGPNLPTSIKVGPNHAIKLSAEAGSGDAVADAKFITANPPLSDLMRLIEMKVALLLSTNNLSTKHIASELSSSADFPSAIAMIVDMAESTEDVEDQAQVFLDAEPRVWETIAAWEDIYADRELLDEKFVKVKLPDDIEVTPVFESAKPIMSEKESLEVLEKRKALGLDRMIDLIMRDKPELTEEQAKARLDEILNESMERAAKMGLTPGAEGEDDDDQGQGDDGDGDGDKRDVRPGVKGPAGADGARDQA
jgi:hypothetical protein